MVPTSELVKGTQRGTRRGSGREGMGGGEGWPVHSKESRVINKLLSIVSSPRGSVASRGCGVRGLPEGVCGGGCPCRGYLGLSAQ